MSPAARRPQAASSPMKMIGGSRIIPAGYGDASDNRWTDNVPNSGDERKVRTTFNPLVQWAFVHVQARASQHLAKPLSDTCLRLARLAASFAGRQDYSRRTLFVAAELRGKLELLAVGDKTINQNEIVVTAQELLQRQASVPEGLSGYFTEAGDSDAYRSIAFAADPALALLRLWELRSLIADAQAAAMAQRAVFAYIEKYLLADSAGNPFGLTPYGVYFDPPQHGPAGISRCRERPWGANLHPSVQFPGHRARHQFSAHEPCAPAGAGCGAFQPGCMARGRGAVASLVPWTQHAQSLAVLRHRLSAAGRIFVPHPADSRGDVRRLHRTTG